MADGGQGFLKMCLTVLPKHYDPSSEKEISEEILEGEEDNNDLAKRSLYSKGGSFGKKGLLTGVNRLIMLCCVPDVNESYENMKILFNLTNLNNIPYKFVADLKLTLTVNGLQTATASFPSPVCFVPLQSLRGDTNVNKVTSEVKDNESLDGLDEMEGGAESANKEELIVVPQCAKLRTFGDIRRDFQKFKDLGSNKIKHGKLCHSTVNEPLFNEPNAMTVVEKCPPGELHMLCGFVNHLFWDGLVPLLGRARALKWPLSLNLISKNYHGDIFEGNACRKLLKNADSLLQIRHDSKLELLPFVSSLKAMDKVVHQVFSPTIKPGLDSTLAHLNKCVKATGLSETLKMHYILHHIPHALHYLHGASLGLWSEQAGESIHRVFLKYWEKYKTNNIHDPAYGDKLKRAVVEFSSRHF